VVALAVLLAGPGCSELHTTFSCNSKSASAKQLRSAGFSDACTIEHKQASGTAIVVDYTESHGDPDAVRRDSVETVHVVLRAFRGTVASIETIAEGGDAPSDVAHLRYSRQDLDGMGSTP
jgi:hypothetical protein